MLKMPDLDFYKNIFGGNDYADTEKLLNRAEREISAVITIEPTSEYQKRLFDFAVCAQAEYMGLCGGVEAWQGVTLGGGRSFTVGSFSMSGGGSASGSGNSAVNALGLCLAAENYLDKAGLLYKGVSVL